MATQPPERHHSIVITGIDVPFIDWVTLLIKVAIASIPATIILGFFVFIVTLGFSMLGMGVGALLR